MKFESISDDKFGKFKNAEIFGNLNQVLGGAVTDGGSRSLGDGSCTMSYGSDTTDGGTTTYHDASFDGDDCPRVDPGGTWTSHQTQSQI